MKILSTLISLAIIGCLFYLCFWLLKKIINKIKLIRNSKNKNVIDNNQPKDNKSN